MKRLYFLIALMFSASLTWGHGAPPPKWAKAGVVILSKYCDSLGVVDTLASPDDTTWFLTGGVIIPDSLWVRSIFVGDTSTGDSDYYVYFATDGDYTTRSLSWNDGNSSFYLSGHIVATNSGSVKAHGMLETNINGGSQYGYVTFFNEGAATTDWLRLDTTANGFQLSKPLYYSTAYNDNNRFIIGDTCVDNLIADEIGSQNAIYGELYVDDAAYDTTLVGTAGTYYIVEGLNDTVQTGDTAGVVAIPDSGRLVIQTTGMYHVWALGSFEHSDGTSATVELALFKNDNGTPAKQNDLEIHHQLTDNDVRTMGFSGLISLTADDTLDLRITSTENSDRVDSRVLNFGVAMVKSYGQDSWHWRNDSLFAVDPDGDTIMVIFDDDAGNVRWRGATEDQSLGIVVDTVGVFYIGMAGDVIDDFSANFSGLTVSSGDLTVAALDSSHIDDNDVAEDDLKIANAPTDEYVVTWEADEGTGGQMKWEERSGSGLTYWTEADDNDTSVFTATGPNTTVGFNDQLTMQGNSITGVDAFTASGTIEGGTLTEGGVAVHNNDEMDGSAELLAIVDDETGSAAGTPLLVFNYGPTFNHKITADSITADSIEAEQVLATAQMRAECDLHTEGNLYVNKDSTDADAVIYFGDNDEVTSMHWDDANDVWEFSDGLNLITGNFTVTSGNIVVSGTVDGVDVGALNTALANDTASYVTNDEMDAGSELLVIYDDETGTGVPVFNIAPNFTGVPTFDSAQFDGNVDVDSMDINGVLDVTGNIAAGGTVDGVDVAALNTDVAADSSSWNATADALGTAIDSTEIDFTTMDEWVSDQILEVLDGGTQTGITVTPEDGTNDMDFVVAVATGEITDQTITKDDIDTTASDFVFDDAYRGTSDVADSAYTTKKYVDDAAGGLTEQSVKGDHVDSTAENFVFDGAYHVTSATSDSAYITIETLEDTAALRLLLAGGEMSGNITMAGAETVDGVDISALNTALATDTANYVQNDEMDASSELLVIMDDETGSAAGSPLLVFNYGPTFNHKITADSITADSIEAEQVLATAQMRDECDLHAEGNVYVNKDSTDADAAIYFGDNDEVTSVHWDDANDRFEFSDAIDITGNITVSGTVDAVDVGVLGGRFDTNYAQITLATVLGSIDAGGATSLEIPAVDNPTTDAEGEIAWDANDDAVEVYSGDEAESALIPMYQCKDALIFAPDGVDDEIAFFHVDALLYPHGIEIDQVSITLNADAAYSMVFEEWSGDAPSAENDISTVTTASDDAYAEETPDTDAAIDADDYIYLHVPSTDVDWVHVQIIFHVVAGN